MNNPDTSQRGLISGGSWCVDHVKVVDAYPPLDALGLILETRCSNGGGPYNLLKDLAIMGANFPLYGIGLVGDDENGRFILHDCRKHDIDTRLLATHPECSTSYTDVISEEVSGRRSFFHHKGANSFLNEGNFDFSAVDAALFHLAYLNLLGSLDKVGDDGETGGTRVLREAVEAGLHTSADLVSFPTSDFSETVRPSLPYVNTLFLNELEASWLTGIDLATDKPIRSSNAKEILTSILAMGVREHVVLHYAEAVVTLDAKGEFFLQGSVRVPESDIAGTAGAGDAFAAGYLYGVHEGRSISRCLELGVCVAASCLYDATTSGSVRKIEDCLKLGNDLGYRPVD